MTAVGSKCRYLPRSGDHRSAAAQRPLLRRALPRAVPQAGGEGDRAVRHARNTTIGYSIAVSGGKDSLAVWDLLASSATPPTVSTSAWASVTTATRQQTHARAFAAERGLASDRGRPTRPVRLRHPDRGRRPRDGCPVPRAVRANDTCSTKPPSKAATTCWSPGTTSTTRPPCCSATRCVGTSSISPVSWPVLSARPGFPKKVKPLVRLTERETAAWCIVRGIDYLVDECPMAAGNKHLAYKAALNAIEEASPGSKANFYLNFVDNMAPLLAGRAIAEGTATRCVLELRRADDR